MKNKKAYSSVLIGFIMIILVVLVIYFGSKQTASIATNYYSTKTSLTYQDQNSATYRFSFSSEGSNPRSFSGDVHYLEENFNIPIDSTESGGALPEFVDGLKQNVIVNATDVEYYGIGGIRDPATSVVKYVDIKFVSKSAECSISKGAAIDGIPRASISCRFKGTVRAIDDQPAQFYGMSGATATITFYKEGYQPPAPIIIPDNGTNATSHIPSTNETTGELGTIQKSFIDEFNSFIDNLINWIKGLLKA